MNQYSFPAPLQPLHYYLPCCCPNDIEQTQGLLMSMVWWSGSFCPSIPSTNCSWISGDIVIWPCLLLICRILRCCRRRLLFILIFSMIKVSLIILFLYIRVNNRLLWYIEISVWSSRTNDKKLVFKRYWLEYVDITSIQQAYERIGSENTWESSRALKTHNSRNSVCRFVSFLAIYLLVNITS